MTKQNKQTINYMFKKTKKKNKKLNLKKKKKKKKKKKTQVNFVQPGFWPWEIL